MRAYAEKISEFHPGKVRPFFTRNQIAFLEDLLINRGCMRALENGKGSTHPEKCQECAVNLAEMVNTIRKMNRR